jgi:hypothetical protein
VLDNEAAQAISDPRHPKYRRVIEILAARGRERAEAFVPTAVRVEAGLSRTRASGLGRLDVEDVALTAERAERAIALCAGLSASVVDAAVAQVAEEHATAGALVTVYTSDVRDLEVLCARAAGRIAVRRV